MFKPVSLPKYLFRISTSSSQISFKVTNGTHELSIDEKFWLSSALILITRWMQPARFSSTCFWKLWKSILIELCPLLTGGTVILSKRFIFYSTFLSYCSSSEVLLMTSFSNKSCETSFKGWSKSLWLLISTVLWRGNLVELYYSGVISNAIIVI